MEATNEWNEEAGIPALNAPAPAAGTTEDGPERVLLRVDGVRIFASDAAIADGTAGTLLVTTRRLRWFSGPALARAVDWRSVALHAVSRDTSAGYPPCVYCQLDSSNDGGDEEGSSSSAELRFAPEDPERSLAEIFARMSEAAAMNPDPANDAELDDDAAFFGDHDPVDDAAAEMDDLATEDADEEDQQ